MKLTEAERTILCNQYLILERLYPEEAEHYQNLAEIARSGYEILYGELSVAGDPPMSEQEGHEALQIVDMYRVLHGTFQRLKDKTGISLKDVTFPGFDGNQESSALGLITFMVEDFNRYEELKGRDLDTHMEMLPRYREMLSRYHGIGKDIRDFTREDVLHILGKPLRA